MAAPTLAQKESALAGYDARVASYRQTVLTAFQEVEDNLAALRVLAHEAVVQQAATKSAEEVLLLTKNQYRAGMVSYLNVVIAQTAALAAQRNSLDIDARQLLANATLVKALGGSWQTSGQTIGQTIGQANAMPARSASSERR